MKSIVMSFTHKQACRR